MAEGSQRRRLHRSTARRVRALVKIKDTKIEITSAWCQPLGTVARVMPKGQDRRIRGGTDEYAAGQGRFNRWKSCAPATASILVWHAPPNVMSPDGQELSKVTVR